MDDLLKEAIADAKAVRETALENAKIALEEAFTPRLQSMLAKKIQSELDVAEQDDEDEDEEDEMDVAPDTETKMYRDDDVSDEEPEVDMGDEEPEVDMGDEEEDEEEPVEGFDESEVIEINGVKYAPVVSEDDEEEDEEDMEPTDEVDDLDLEAILRELETDEDVEEAHEPGHDEDEDDEPTTETIDEDDDDDESKDDVEEEVDQSSGIGSSDNKKGATDKSSAIGSKGKAKHESVEITEGDDDLDEDIDLEEVIKALSEEEDEEDATNEVAKLQSDLDEHRNVVKYLRSKLNEVNLLNAKLLFTNKLFRSFGLSNDQKMKVVENFDRAHNLREVKLVYSTLAESFGTKKTKTEIKEHKGSASKAVASTKSEKQEVIAEGSELRDRFKKLAGII